MCDDSTSAGDFRLQFWSQLYVFSLLFSTVSQQDGIRIVFHDSKVRFANPTTGDRALFLTQASLWGRQKEIQE